MEVIIIGLISSLSIIGVSIVALIFVAKITEIGGAAYNWEYIPPGILLVFGIGNSGYWLWRIFTTR
jgi:hypothetical protein